MNKTLGYKIEESKGIKFVTFDHIKETGLFVHAFSTRTGGVSAPPYDTLNLGFTTRDNPGDEEENRARFMSSLGMKPDGFKMRINLVHENLVLNLSEIPAGPAPCADGMATGEPLTPLITTFADCIPVFLADPVKKCIALLHAGWRGTFARIAERGIFKMQEDFGSDPGSILAGIGPGIGRCCFIVSSEVADSFTAKFNPWKDLIGISSNNEKWKIDLFNLNKRILLESGLNETNIVIADICTSCHPELFYSYRRDNGTTGRMAALLAIR